VGPAQALGSWINVNQPDLICKLYANSCVVDTRADDNGAVPAYFASAYFAPTSHRRKIAAIS